MRAPVVPPSAMPPHMARVLQEQVKQVMLWSVAPMVPVASMVLLALMVPLLLSALLAVLVTPHCRLVKLSKMGPALTMTPTQVPTLR